MFDRPAVLKIALCRLAGRAARGGPIDTVRFKDRLKLCREQMAAVLASRLDPETTIVLKGNKPLELRIHKRHRAVLYTPTRHTWTRSWTRSAAGASCPSRP